MEKTETVVLVCTDEQNEAFHSALLQLGYTIIDESWDDKNHVVHFTVKKKWLTLL